MDRKKRNPRSSHVHLLTCGVTLLHCLVLSATCTVYELALHFSQRVYVSNGRTQAKNLHEIC